MAIPARGDCFVRGCVSRSVLAHVTGRWGWLIVAALRRTPTLRFSALRTQIEGISEKMLAQTLRELERDGVVRRKSFDEVPPRVEYSLTQLGTGIAEHIDALRSYIETHVRDLVHARADYDGITPAEAWRRLNDTGETSTAVT